MADEPPTTPGSADTVRDRLLVVDDEPAILDTVSRFLRFIGYDVRTAATAHEALASARDFLPDLILLDVMLPDGDGFEVMHRLRADGLPHAVVFLTARDTRKDLVRGLTEGGDDYITKPFGLDEVAARISAVLRRTRRPRNADPVLRVADLELDTATYSVRRSGTPVDLSPTEFRLLRYLMLHSGRVIPRAQLLEHIWSYDFNGDDTVVATYISYLRRKIDALGPGLIHTQRGVGYSIREPHR
ncbi:response regulator transcription factor [Streptomyces sp. NBC_01352]|uniref:Response regulator transcription factor n=1 Tax=Streptomyces plumbiresistens TaxID=511811 RepID=A0ABP7RJY9_9ACTN|nr:MULTISPECIES: response regulator transcription factor [unclassified Streptomyces]MCX4703750.1 response regulator transcription factor [Streptomyces sp. NBC_01373]